MIFTMLNFLKERHKHNFEDIIWYEIYYDEGYGIQVYRANVCDCGSIKNKRRIYHGRFSYKSIREEKINWWEEQGAITEEEFAFKYR